jgi:hypothetical protein
LNLVFALKILADLSFFMFAIASVASAAPHSGLLLTSPLIVALAAYFSRLLHTSQPKRWYLRFLPLALTPACFLFAKTGADRFVTVPMILYLAAVAARKSYVLDYASALERFMTCLKLLFVPMLLVVIAGNWRGFLDVMLPYFFFFLVLSVILLRMLRHNDAVITDRRFRLMNLGEILLLCGAGYLLSSGYALALARFLVSLAVRYLLRPLFMGILYVFAGFAWLLNKIFSGIDFGDIDFEGIEQLGQEMQESEGFMEAAQSGEHGAAMQISTYVLIGIGAAIVVLVVILLFRALMRAGRRDADNRFDDVRESLDDAKSARDRRLTRAPRDRVRHTYRKFLKLCDARGIGTGEYLNSAQINEQARHVFRTPALSALRDVYLKARYTTADIGADDVRRAKNAYDQVKKSGG